MTTNKDNTIRNISIGVAGVVVLLLVVCGLRYISWRKSKVELRPTVGGRIETIETTTPREVGQAGTWRMVGLRMGPNWADRKEQQDYLEGITSWGTVGSTTASWGTIYEEEVPRWREIKFITRKNVNLSPPGEREVLGRKWIVLQKMNYSTSVKLSGRISYSRIIVISSWNSTTEFFSDRISRGIPGDPFIFASVDGKTATEDGLYLNGDPVPFYDCYYGESIGPENNALLVEGKGMEIWIR